MKSINLIPETIPEHNDQPEIGRHNENKETSLSGNAAAKRELAAELIAQGVTEEAVCRILHISATELPEDEVQTIYPGG